MEKKIKTAAYCRVSTLSDEQGVSLSNQTSRYEEYIKGNPEYEFAGIYADKISGKSAEKRAQFMKLLKACRNKEVQLVITKSISRFARNLCETLEVVRELRRLGIGVIFEKENINTLDATSDLRLSLYATFAEKELDSLSGNIRWAARKRYQSGEVEFSVMYGYRYLGDKKLEIIPEEAEVVRQVFDLYISGLGCRAIATKLNQHRIKRKLGNTPWTAADILRMLRNEKYTGHAILQKTVANDSFKKIKNKGHAPQYFVENNHDAIIKQETFDKANEILASRKWTRDSVKPVEHSVFAGKLKCVCGTNYSRRNQYHTNSNSYWVWECIRYSSSGKDACPKSFQVKEVELKELFLSAYNDAAGKGATESKLAQLSGTLQELLSQEREMAAFKAKGYIGKQAYEKEQDKLISQIKEIEAEYSEIVRRESVGIMKPQSEYSEDMVRFLDFADVKGLSITFTFKNGAKIYRAMSTFRRRKRED